MRTSAAANKDKPLSQHVYGSHGQIEILARKKLSLGAMLILGVVKPTRQLEEIP
jgi:hypothetical protein